MTDPAQLRELEARVVSIRDVELARQTLPGEYNTAHLQSFHQRLFGDVYDWAGEFRRVDISRGDVTFANWRFLDTEVATVLAGLRADNCLTGMAKEKFIERLAFHYGELNARHPFREGNGRAQRAFFRQVAAHAGYRLDWSELTAADNINASRHNMLTGSTAMLVSAFDRVVVRM